MNANEQMAVIALVRDRDYALTSVAALGKILGRAIDRFNETGDDEGLEIMRAMMGEHFHD